MRVKVAIIGGGPSGLLLSQLLTKAGIETLVLERRTRDYVLSRIRAGVLEGGTVDLLRQAGAGARMDKEGMPHGGCLFAYDNRSFRVDFEEACGRGVMVYGQTEVTRDLYAAQDVAGATIVHEVEDVAIHDAASEAPFVTYRKDGTEIRVDCDFVVGCDGFHGVSRKTIPDTIRKDFEKVYPFGWLGILSETPPADHELIYANHARGFALASMRSEHLSRYYIQVPQDEKIEAWSDDAFFDELRRRLPRQAAETMITGPSIEKSIAPLRSFVSEPMRHGRLYLCGDASHIVPPTGAKGLNLAVSDVRYLWIALLSHYQDKDDRGLDTYSDIALARVWKAIRFSWWMTTMLHRFPGQSDFDQRVQESELEYIERSPAARTVLAENYTGLPF